ncbi:circadian clock-controlled protein daywake-like [Battus philenor]|uniref:circadian clock-controlled protein daywake-like n=1 Tax=Battus philenor TaxID=42288 RepID=UPI0035D0EC37
MLSKIIVLTWLCAAEAFSGSSSIIRPCNRNDEACITQSANIAMPLIAAGIPALGVDGFDPMHLEEASGVVENFVFNFTNNDAVGYSKCIISGLQMNLNAMTLKFDFICPRVDLSGHLVSSGILLDVPVWGDDDYKISVNKYLVKVNAKIEKVMGNDGEMHMFIVVLDHKESALAPIDFKNYALKQKTKLDAEAEALFEKNKFVKAIELISETYIDGLFKIAFKNVNKFLATIPFDDLFLD